MQLSNSNVYIGVKFQMNEGKMSLDDLFGKRTEEEQFRERIRKLNEHIENDREEDAKRLQAVDEWLSTPHLGLRGSENVRSTRIKEALELFELATKNKIEAQKLKFECQDREAHKAKAIEATKQYMAIAELCYDKDETSILDERMRRILLMDSYESIADMLLLPDTFILENGTYQNAATFYEMLKTEVIGFKELAKKNMFFPEDLAEANTILFNSVMSLSAMYLYLQDLDGSCNETLLGLELMKSRTNPQGIDYAKYVPYKLRQASYASKRFSKCKRNNQESPYFDSFDENPLRKYNLTTKEKQAHVVSILHRRKKSETAIISMSSYLERLQGIKFLDGDESKESIFRRTFDDIAHDPTNERGYVALFFLEKSPLDSDRELFQKAVQIYDKIRIKKAETGNFDMSLVHSEYPFVLTDGERVYKREPTKKQADNHVKLLQFLRDNCKMKFSWGKVHITNAENYFVEMQLAQSRNNGKPEQEYRACSLEDMDILYEAEVKRKHMPMPEDRSGFCKKKLKQTIDAMIELRNAGEQNKEKFREYDLEIPVYSYKQVWEDEILRYLKLDETTKDIGIKCVDKLDTSIKKFNHGDFHSGNILFIEGMPVIIDPVQACFASEFRDLANLLEQDSFRDMSWEEKNELIDYYVENSGLNKDSTQDQMQLYLTEAIYTNLLFAKKSSNPNRFYYSPEARDRFIERAKGLIEKVKCP